jgi:arylsulfatase
MPAQVGASIGGRSWELTATIDRPAKTNGVLYASGTENAGLSIFIQNDRLVFDYNCFGNHQIADSTIEVPVGGSKVGVRFLRTGGTGKATLLINDQECGQVDIPLVMNIMSSVGPSVGYDHGSPVSDRYSDEFAFGGQLVTVEIQLDSQSAAEAKENAAAQARAAMAQQ